jgi:hypothetical protein
MGEAEWISGNSTLYYSVTMMFRQDDSHFPRGLCGVAKTHPTESQRERTFQRHVVRVSRVASEIVLYKSSPLCVLARITSTYRVSNSIRRGGMSTDDQAHPPSRAIEYPFLTPSHYPLLCLRSGSDVRPKSQPSSSTRLHARPISPGLVRRESRILFLSSSISFVSTRA